jgi:hypothetical protein
MEGGGGDERSARRTLCERVERNRSDEDGKIHFTPSDFSENQICNIYRLVVLVRNAPLSRFPKLFATPA